MNANQRCLLSILALLAPCPALARPTTHHHIAPTATEDARFRQILAADELREAALNPLDRISSGEQIDPAALTRIFTPALDQAQLASAR